MNKNKFAKAPYNFVPINENVIKAQELPKSFKKYYEERYSGIIELKITTKTPLFIRRIEGDKEFFSIDGKPRIPGSSLRGMIRTLVEIVSYSKMKFIDDKRLFYRAVADISSLGKKYRKTVRNVKAGYLFYDENDDRYYIIPAPNINGKGTFTSFKDTSKEFFIEPTKDGYKVWSGRIKGKKKNWIVLLPDKTDTKKLIPEKVIQDYKNDKGRNTKVFDLLDMAKKKRFENIELNYGPPVFYICDENNEILAFGHTPNFRLPYSMTIAEHLPEDHKSNDKHDFAEAIFGVASPPQFSTRVFFEDATLLGENSNEIFLKTTYPKILSSPKPTSFQLYLDQNSENNKDKKELKHWDDEDAFIRGFKLYWHRNTPNKPPSSDNQPDYSWNMGETPQDKTNVLSTMITPIRSGVTFIGNIRFENLTKEELGSLLFVLDLPDNCCHKLGLGKPLGLGSVKIAVDLYLLNRKDRYSRLFKPEEKCWEEAKTKGDIDYFKNAFEKYILEKIDESQKSLWDVPRIKQLRHLLHWDNNNIEKWLEKTRYMFIQCDRSKYDCLCSDKDKCNEFRKRDILPKPEDVVEDDENG